MKKNKPYGAAAALLATTLVCEVPFLAAAAVMLATYHLTSPIAPPLPLILTKTAVAAMLYWLTMRLLHDGILAECHAYLINTVIRKRK